VAQPEERLAETVVVDEGFLYGALLRYFLSPHTRYLRLMRRKKNCRIGVVSFVSCEIGISLQYSGGKESTFSPFQTPTSTSFRIFSDFYVFSSRFLQSKRGIRVDTRQMFHACKVGVLGIEKQRGTCWLVCSSV
jgi:hypothetical protein